MGGSDRAPKRAVEAIGGPGVISPVPPSVAMERTSAVTLTTSEQRRRIEANRARAVQLRQEAK